MREPGVDRLLDFRISGFVILSGLVIRHSSFFNPPAGK
jgi:hypothetical protein